MSYKIVIRSTQEEVTIPEQPEFFRQTLRYKEIRAKYKEMGMETSDVFLVKVQMPDGSFANVDTKALLIRYYHTENMVRTQAFQEVFAAVEFGKKVEKTDPKRAKQIYAYAEMQLWLAVTHNLPDEQKEVFKDSGRRLTNQGDASSSIELSDMLEWS